MEIAGCFASAVLWWSIAASRFLCHSCLLSRGTPTAGCMDGPTGRGAFGSSCLAPEQMVKSLKLPVLYRYIIILHISYVNPSMLSWIAPENFIKHINHIKMVKIHSTHLLHLHPDNILQWAGDSSWVSSECSTAAESCVTHPPLSHGLEQSLDLCETHNPLSCRKQIGTTKGYRVAGIHL